VSVKKCRLETEESGEIEGLRSAGPAAHGRQQALFDLCADALAAAGRGPSF
jgi:hypothetical protein